MSVACGSAGKGEDLKKYSKETVIVENALLVGYQKLKKCLIQFLHEIRLYYLFFFQATFNENTRCDA